MNWNVLLKPAEITEKRLVEAILDGQFPIDSVLPGERELAARLGVTRPTLREALQRLARDGWVDIQQGKSTRVRNYWEEGNLAVLATIARHVERLPKGFIPNLLQVRKLLAPEYARLAVETRAGELSRFLGTYTALPDNPEAFTSADWALHHRLTVYSGNAVFTLILNGFRELYPLLGERYFQLLEGREASRLFYNRLLECARGEDSQGAEQVTREAMERSCEIWKKIEEGYV